MSRCSVKMMILRRRRSDPDASLSVSSSRSSVHFLSVPQCRTRRASSIEVGEDRDLLVELGDRAGGGGGVGDLGLELLGLLARQVVAVAAASLRSASGSLPSRSRSRRARSSSVADAAAVAHLVRGASPGACGGVPATCRIASGLDARRRCSTVRAKPTVKPRLPSPASLEPVGAVHLLADVLGDRLVQVLLGLGQLVGDGVGAALGEQRLALEGQRSSLTMRRISPSVFTVCTAVAVPALEPVGVEQRQEQLEVLLPARVRGRGHQQEVPGVSARAARRAGSAWSSSARCRSSARTSGAPRRPPPGPSRRAPAAP